MWLTEQRRLTQETLNETIDAVRKSMAWFVDDGFANAFDVVGEIVPLSGITLTETITALDGQVENRYINLWEVTGNAN